MSYNPNNPNGQATMANSTPVVIASDQSSVPIDDNGGSITIDGTVNVGNFPATQPVSGTVTVQQGTAANLNATVTGSVSVSNFPATQPISGTVSANLNAGTNYVGNVRLTDGITDAEVVPLAGFNAQAVAIVDGSGNQVTSFGGGTQYADGTAVATPTGTVSLGFDGANVQALSTTAAGLLNIADGGGTITVDGTVTANAGTGTFTVGGTVAATQSGVWNVGLNAGTNAIGSITNTSFIATQATAANLNATVVGTGTFAVQAAQSGTWILDANSGVDIGDVTINNAAGAAAVNIQDGGNTITVDGTVAATQSGTWNIGTLTSITNTVTVSGTVTASNTSGDVAHDSPDSGNPVKIGFQAETTLPTAVATGDRTNGIADRYGRQMVTHIDPAMQVWDSHESSATQTGVNIWVPVVGNRFVITELHISTGGTTAGIVTIWGAQTATTVYVAGTDQAFFRGEFAPTANSKPGAIISPSFPMFSDTTNDCLKITTSTAMTVYVQVYGYEITP